MSEPLSKTFTKQELLEAANLYTNLIASEARWNSQTPVSEIQERRTRDYGFLATFIEKQFP